VEPDIRSAAAAPLAGAVKNLLALQGSQGCWEGEVAWNTMLLSQYVLTCRMVRKWPLSEHDRDGILRHFKVAMLPDGSWPLHCEGAGSPFVTTLAYVALRVMGLQSEAPLVAGARHWLHDQQDSVTLLPTWGRVWLAMLGLYEYEGINPIQPEALLLPRWTPVHPDRLYVHTRLIYVGMSCLYARRTRFDLGPLTGQLRRRHRCCSLHVTTLDRPGRRRAFRRPDDSCGLADEQPHVITARTYGHADVSESARSHAYAA
jgi:hypothetical protein